MSLSSSSLNFELRMHVTVFYDAAYKDFPYYTNLIYIMHRCA